MSDYLDIYQYMTAAGYDRVNGCDFFQEIFPDCENSGDGGLDYKHPNAVYLYYDGSDDYQRLRRRIMLKDTWEDDYARFVHDNDLTLCSGLTYRGRANKLENAQRMNALVFDIDSVGLEEFRIIEARWEVSPGAYRAIPRPTYTVLSGTGLHLWYLFDEPIDLYPNIKIQLKSLKYDITGTIWEYGQTTKERNIQYQSINQGFRMPGSYNCKEKEKKRVEAFRTGERVTLDYLNMYVVDPANVVDLEKPFKPTKKTRKEAQEAYPEWYERVVVPQLKKREVERELQNEDISEERREYLLTQLYQLRGEVRRGKKPKKWEMDSKVNGDDPYALYHWWIGKSKNVLLGNKPDMKKLVKGGHRYFYLMCMAIYADKCNVPRKMLVEDMKEIFDEIAAIPHKNPLTKADMDSALEAYSREYYDTSIGEINYWTGVGIEKNRRNKRTKKKHVERMTKDKADMMEEGTPFANPEGRPPKSSIQREKVIVYKSEHPDSTPADCKAATGVSRNTVYRWWKEEVKIGELKRMKRHLKGLEEYEALLERNKLYRKRHSDEES